MKKYFSIFCQVGLFLVLSNSVQAQSPLPIKQLSVGIHLIQAEVAATPNERATGLMFREKMGQNHGMLFIFDRQERACMWMKNTLIPLSVAYLEEDGTVVNIEEMQAQTEESHCALKPIRYALEMNKGWFAQKNIKPGSRIQGLHYP